MSVDTAVSQGHPHSVSVLTLYIAAGGAVGSAARYLLGIAIQQRAGSGFPAGTLVINITGSFLLAFFLRSALASSAVTPEVRAFLTTGFCGGYTTFSTFSYDTVGLAQGGQYGRAAAYVALSVVVSIMAAFVGIAAAQWLLQLRGRI